MDPVPVENDSSSRCEGHEVHPIRRMESVVATVSGYHGTERFKLIKLIAQTGANYVGAMARSTTHLVCWQFEGKKHDLAREFGTHIISHRWFEDCLKEGKRLPEDPYTMQSGQEAGPISWELPVILDARGKKKNLSTRGRNVFSDQSNASDFNEVVDIDASCFDVVLLNWPDSHLLNENSAASLSNKTKGSKNVGKSKNDLRQYCKSSNEGHPKPLVYALGNWESSSYSSGCSSRNKRNSCDASGNGVNGEPARRSRRLVKKSASNNLLNCALLDCKREYCQRESCDPLKSNSPVSFDLDNLRNVMASSTQGMISENMSTIFKESRRQALQQDEDIGELNNFHGSINSNSSRSCALSAIETSQNEHCERIQKNIDFCDFGVNQNERGKEGDGRGKSAALHTTELSCVICWTDFCSTRGVLHCGHRFCYSCIQGWADCMISRGKVSTCPLCKTSFSHITKFEETASYDQKIYSQTIPCGSSNTDVFMLPDSRHDNHDTLPSDSACYECHNHEPEDLLVCCRICQNQWVHSCCLDPPLVPWTCIRCTDLRMLYQRFH